MEFNVADVHEAIAQRIPDRECLVYGERRFTWRQLTERTRRLANVLLAHGLGLQRERSELATWESGQSHLALYLYNCNEYLEGMLGAYKARVAPFNVNYQYKARELEKLLVDAGASGVIYHARFAPLLRDVLTALGGCRLLLQVADGSGQPLLPGALDYEAALASASAESPRVERSPDDLYLLYTGGTTGAPKGVLWRQADIFVTAFGGRKRDGGEFVSQEEAISAAADRHDVHRVLPAPPFMHAAAQWTAFVAFFMGNTVVIQGQTTRLDARDLLSTAECERVAAMLIIGDAFAKPMLEELERRPYDLGQLLMLMSGGAALSAANKRALLEHLPNVRVMDTIGSSEAGTQGHHLSTAGGGAATGSFEPTPGSCVVDATMTRVLSPGHHGEDGWFARTGRIPLGYLGDREKTEKTFPVIAGTRYSVPGDRARHRADGSIQVLGREAVTINTGGEKVYAEEVDETLRSHPQVRDAVTVPRESLRWGQKVVAIVELRPGAELTQAELREFCAASGLAAYKVPKALVFLAKVERLENQKPDYSWAKAQAAEHVDGD